MKKADLPGTGPELSIKYACDKDMQRDGKSDAFAKGALDFNFHYLFFSDGISAGLFK